MLSERNTNSKELFINLLPIINRSYPSHDLSFEDFKTSPDYSIPLIISPILKKAFIVRSSESALTDTNFIPQVKSIFSTFKDFEVCIAFYDIKFNVFYYQLFLDM